MSNFGNFIFRDNAIVNRIISISFRFDAAKVNCGRRASVWSTFYIGDGAAAFYSG